MTSGPSDKEAWSDYWKDRPSGCLPDASSALEQTFRDQWRRVSTEIPERGRVLDLASGSGDVLRWLSEERSDLDLTGIDLAEPLPPPPPGINLMLGGVAMEKLPFEPATFDTIVSQFGLEYGSLDASLAEAARVLRPGGNMALVTHHYAGPIVANNRTRASGLKWALDEERLITRAARAVTADEHSAIHAAPRVAAGLFGQRSAAWEFAEAVSRTLQMPGSAIAGTLAMLERKARGEMQRIKALEVAAAAIAEPQKLQTVMHRRGLDLVAERPIIHTASGFTIANFWMFKRR